MKFKQSVVGPKGQLHHHKVPAVSDLHLSAGTESTLSELTITRQLGAQSARRTRLKQVAVLALFVIGLIVCVSSLSCILLLPQFVTNQIAKRLVLKNNSLLLERWSKPNVPMYFKVWLFDVKNAAEVSTNRGTKPKLQEIGPFVFRLKRQKDVVSFAGDNLYYTERKLYHFDRELSCCAINTTVTIPNIPLVAVVDRALGYNLPLVGRFIPRLINRAIQSLREQLFVRKQVRELLFDGYDVELLKMVSRVGSLVGMPQTQQRFALFKGRNDSWRPEQDGVFAINTGASDRRKFGKVTSWNSHRQLPFWSSPGCNTINGSDGTLFPPPIRRDEPLYIFNAELCRTVNLVYQQPSEIRSIQALRFVLNPMNFAHTMDRTSNVPLAKSASSQPPLSLARRSQPPKPLIPFRTQALNNEMKHRNNNNNSNNNEKKKKKKKRKRKKRATHENQLRHVEAAQDSTLTRTSPRNPFTCFCERKSTQLNGVNVCEYDGLIDLSKCTKQAQVIFGSMPHFHQSDPRLARQVIGMEPNASRHTTYLDIEPNTGLVLGGKRRVQLNLLIKRNNEVDGFENINDMLVPLIWIEESAVIPEESAQKFRSLYTDRIRLVNLVLTTLFLASIGLLAIDARLILALYKNSQLKWRLAAANTNADDDDASKPIEENSKSFLKNSATLNSAKRLADSSRRILVKVPFEQSRGDERTSEITQMQTNGSGEPLLISNKTAATANRQQNTSSSSSSASRNNSFSSSQQDYNTGNGNNVSQQNH